VRGVGEVGKLNLPGPILRLRGPNHLTTNAVGFVASGPLCAPLYPCTRFAILSLPPSLCLKKKRRKKEIGRKYQDLEGVVLPSFLSHGGTRFIPFYHYTKPTVETRESWVYGSGRAQGLSVTGGPCVPCAYGRIHGILYRILYERGFGMPPHQFLHSLL
jgi:hypothetical protein